MSNSWVLLTKIYCDSHRHCSFSLILVSFMCLPSLILYQGYLLPPRCVFLVPHEGNGGDRSSSAADFYPRPRPIFLKNRFPMAGFLLSCPFSCSLRDLMREDKEKKGSVPHE
uniref:Uncharacterized protein n=1 Tax=Cacopsylla melanoneura TaxID=428564 RepID=A0A8D8R1M4_9HEMI